MTSKKIVKCSIGPYPKSRMDFGNIPHVKVVFEDGEEKDLFTFYPDELRFSESEFIGLTEEQARKLRHDKDVAYLRS